MRFRVWAPFAESSVTLVLDGEPHRMQRAGGGWWEADREAVPGARYAFAIDDGEPRADPRALSLPDGPEGPAQVIDREQLSAATVAWDGIELHGAVIYELHVGTFTPEGTLDSAIERLDHLVELGAGIVEVMPLATFPGRHGWGYDGVGLYAVHEPYGGPLAFRRFVDACHARGLGVCLDVVYNHLGPSGNHLAEFGPYFTDRYATPWGQAVNLDGAGSDDVRRFILDNALMWLRDFHVDGLRLDAVHTLFDNRATTLLEELAGEVAALSDEVGRPLWLIAESDRNDPRTVTGGEAGGLGLDAQWADDVHHALHVLLTGETQGYYADFAAPGALAKVLEGVFLHDGRWSSFRGRTHGRPLDRTAIPGFRFVVSLQTHDQVGNRALGDRLSAGISPGPARVRRRAAAHRRGHADALHGRGMGRLDAVDVLHRSHGSGDRGRRQERAAAGVRRARVESLRRARSPSRRDVRGLTAGLGGAAAGAAQPAARVVPRPDRTAARARRPARSRGSTRCASPTTPRPGRSSCAGASTWSSSTSRASRARCGWAARPVTGRSCWPGIPRLPRRQARGSTWPPNRRSYSGRAEVFDLHEAGKAL